MNRLFVFITGCIFLIFGGLCGIYEIVTHNKGNNGNKSKNE